MTKNPPGKSGNLILFMLLAFGVVVVHGMFFPPAEVPPKDDGKAAAVAKDNEDAKGDEGDKNKADEGPAIRSDEDPESEKDADETEKDADEKGGAEAEKAKDDDTVQEEEADQKADNDKPVDPSKEVLPTDEPSKWITLGSADPESPYAMLVTLTDRGAAVTRVELNSPRYPQLMDDDGYLADRQGYLGRIVIGKSTGGKGCLVDVVGKGTPAEKAGIKPGDRILNLNGKEITDSASYFAAMSKTRPKRTIDITVLQDGKELALKAKLTRPPIEVVRPEGDDPLSFLMTMSQLGDKKLEGDKSNEEEKSDVFPKACPDYVTEELPGLNLRTGSWKIASQSDSKVVFECELPGQDLKLTKTYRLAKTDGEDAEAGAYHLMLNVKVENLGQKKIEAAYQLDGPTGLPLEGWWYANKVGYCWGAGLRDVIVSFDENTPSMVSCSTISGDELPQEWKDQSLSYLGVDAQYFSCVMIPQKESQKEIWLAESQSIRVGSVESADEKRLTNVSCRMQSKTAELGPGKSIEHSYKIFTGPKADDILEAYNLEAFIYYGWFHYAAQPMVSILHFFHGIVMNYGLAIIMLTVLVRGAMYPMSRKQALAAAKMAELQPEIKKIQEKYKKDMEGRQKAQQALFKKHNYNPLAGCLVMFIQLPIFIGLYRGLMVDIELRGSSLLGAGVRWCSNLSAPDMMIDWHTWMYSGITSGIGIFGLGPYFNLLPILTIVLFIVQQKLMMPPATDPAQEMQQKMMKYMMVFMGLLFFKVASGLCIYFIASSLWGVAERKLLPKHPSKDKKPPDNPPSAHRKKRKK